MVVMCDHIGSVGKFESMNTGGGPQTMRGPQGLRDRTWLRPPAELAGEREELVIDRNAEKQVSIVSSATYDDFCRSMRAN
jgi:hypothetical protein